MVSTRPAQKEQTFLLGIYLPLPLPGLSLSFDDELLGFGIFIQNFLY